MSGGITQLVAIGAQDAHLVGQPEVSFFRSNYKRHTNYAHVVDRQTIQGNPSANGMSTVRFERKGDLLSYVYLTRVDTSVSPPVSAAINGSYVSKVELLIGGQVIDEQDSTFSLNLGSKLLSSTSGKNANDTSNFYPLHFSFCENWQSALPLVALQYHDVELRITWGSSVASTDQLECWANFIYLDTQERQELANKPQNMLIHQTQKAIASNSPTMELNFNHPIKFLCAAEDIIPTPISKTLKLQINGTDVSNPKKYDPHFRQAAFYHHCPYSVAGSLDTNGFLYPFCLETNKLQPTGTLNFSRLDSARLVTDDSAIDQDVYAVNYNILRIQNGMGGLMYAN